MNKKIFVGTNQIVPTLNKDFLFRNLRTNLNFEIRFSFYNCTKNAVDFAYTLL